MTELAQAAQEPTEIPTTTPAQNPTLTPNPAAPNTTATPATAAVNATITTAGNSPQGRQRTYAWADPLQTAAAGAQLSGLEFLTALAEGRVAPPPILNTMDFDGAVFADGRAEFSLTPQEFHYNPIGSVHGGVFATMLDSACGCAVHSKLPAGVFYTSLDLSVKFLRPVSTATGRITAVGTVVHIGRRMALAEAKIVDAAGRVYATANSSCLIMRPE
ncbi:MAG TPA: PaaI family thioesterase [Actinocrinis sp.]|nr:PaaI family thioesterase [Actinocrinis sp.]